MNVLTTIRRSHGMEERMSWRSIQDSCSTISSQLMGALGGNTVWISGPKVRPEKESVVALGSAYPVVGSGVSSETWQEFPPSVVMATSWESTIRAWREIQVEP